METILRHEPILEAIELLEEVVEDVSYKIVEVKDDKFNFILTWDGGELEVTDSTIGEIVESIKEVVEFETAD